MDDHDLTSAKALFAAADENGDGTLDKDEMIRVFSKILPDFTPDDVTDLINGVDTDGDGKMNVDEFLEWVWNPEGSHTAAQEKMQEVVSAELIVYGREQCGCCAHFMSQCDAAEIKYRLMSCDEPEGCQEMWQKAMPTEWFKASGGSVGLPIVDVYGTCLMRPSIDDVKRYSPLSLFEKPAEERTEESEDAKDSGVGELIVYGREQCGMCKRFKSQCDESGFAYSEVSCDEPEGNREMWKKARATEWFKRSGGSVGLPIVDVYGTCLMRPSMAEVQKIKDSMCDIQETLDAHNKLRAAHGAPPLKWDNECAEYAKRCAKENHENGRMNHCELESAEGRRMGQNIYWCSRPNTEAAAVQAWYDEILDPGYDFDSPGFSHGTGHFTQVVWYNTTHVGMSKSPCGCFIVANYYPAGNFMGQFPDNVLPRDTPFEFKPRNKKEKELFDTFQDIDIVTDGKADRTALKEFFENGGESDLAAACDSIAANEDGTVDAKAFVMGMVDIAKSDDHLIDKNLPRFVGFIKFDENGDARLSKEELIRFMASTSPPRLSSAKAEALIEKFDADDDGQVSYKELVNMMDSNGLFDAGESGPQTIESWSDDMDAWLADVPFTDYVQRLKQHVQRGGTAEVDKGDTYIKCKLISPHGWSSFSGTWG